MKRIQRFKDQILFSLFCLCPTFSSVLAGSGEAVSEVNGLINKLYTPIHWFFDYNLCSRNVNTGNAF